MCAQGYDGGVYIVGFIEFVYRCVLEDLVRRLYIGGCMFRCVYNNIKEQCMYIGVYPRI